MRTATLLLAGTTLLGAGASLPTLVQPSASPPPGAAPAASVGSQPWTRHAVPLSPSSFYYDNIQAYPTDPDSALVTAYVRSEVTSTGPKSATLDTWKFNEAFYDVTGKAVQVRGVKHKPTTNPYVDPELERQLSNVRFPTGLTVKGAEGSDGQLTIVDRAYDADGNPANGVGTLWEMWKFGTDPATGRPTAAHGGRIDNLTASQGIFAPRYGVAAAGISMGAGMVSLKDLRQGSIDHALYVKMVRVRPGHWWPANRDDGFDGDGAGTADPWMMAKNPQEGMRFRFRKDVNCATMTTYVATLVCRAGQTHGLILADKTGSIGFDAENEASIMQQNGGRSPYTQPFTLDNGRVMPKGLLEGKGTYNVLASLPWDKLELVQRGTSVKPGSTQVVSPR